MAPRPDRTLGPRALGSSAQGPRALGPSTLGLRGAHRRLISSRVQVERAPRSPQVTPKHMDNVPSWRDAQGDGGGPRFPRGCCQRIVASAAPYRAPTGAPIGPLQGPYRGPYRALDANAIKTPSSPAPKGCLWGSTPPIGAKTTPTKPLPPKHRPNPRQGQGAGGWSTPL